MEQQNRNWYDILWCPQDTTAGYLNPLVLSQEAAATTVRTPLFKSNKPGHRPMLFPDFPYQSKQERVLRILVQSINDETEYQHNACFERLKNAVEKTKHTYLVLTKYPLLFAQKRLLLKENVWTGIHISSDSGLPFGTNELLDMFPNNNWFYHIDLDVCFAALPQDLCKTVKWLVLDCEEVNKNDAQHNILTRRSIVRELVRRADEKRIPVFMTENLSAVVPKKEFRRVLPYK